MTPEWLRHASITRRPRRRRRAARADARRRRRAARADARRRRRAARATRRRRRAARADARRRRGVRLGHAAGHARRRRHVLRASAAQAAHAPREPAMLAADRGGRRVTTALHPGTGGVRVGSTWIDAWTAAADGHGVMRHRRRPRRRQRRRRRPSSASGRCTRVANATWRASETDDAFPSQPHAARVQAWQKKERPPEGGRGCAGQGKDAYCEELRRAFQASSNDVNEKFPLGGWPTALGMVLSSPGVTL